MIKTLRGRFILSHVLPLLLVVPLVTAALIYILETQILLTEVSEELLMQTALLATALESESAIWTNTDEATRFVNQYQVSVSGGIVLLDPQGDLVVSGREDGMMLDGGSVATAVAGERAIYLTYGITEQTAQVYMPIIDANEQLIGIVGMTETLDSVASQFGQLRWLVVGVLVVGLLMGGLIGWWLAVRLEVPISAAATAVVDIADGRSIDPLPERGPAEVRQLTRAVNTLSERLRLLEEIRRRSLANIVHELGRPLGAIRSAIHVLQQGVGDDVEIRQELLGGVEEAIEGMKPILDDLSLLHGQTVGQVTLQRQSVAMSDWLLSLLLPWRAAAHDRDLHWQSDIPDQLPTLQIDPDRLAQVVGNLLSNAIKYTPAGGSVTITAVGLPNELQIQISDTGPGIIAEEQVRIFDPFFRSQQERRFPQGLGIGLTIARDLVQAHGGQITLQSERGKGSTFTIHLPIA